ncbi:prepilin-type N-terminal cleavage/methylation domain-containing protein [bacterium]|nr:MAG: prepilin-type N-terminal cleavage/methylation domain-containing protein [bacterium]
MKRAFTLIELLVVIAIIAVLAAILFPVFAQAKRAAKATASLSNVKQLALAALMYSNDHDDVIVLSGSYNTGDDPIKLDDNGDSVGISPWSWLITPYVKTGALYDDPTGTPTGSLYGFSELVSKIVVPQYGFNHTYLSPTIDGGEAQVGIATTSLGDGAGTVMLTSKYAYADSVGLQDGYFYSLGFFGAPLWTTVEVPNCYNAEPAVLCAASWGIDHEFMNADGIQGILSAEAGAYSGGVSTRGGGAIVAFTDGHAKKMSLGALAGGTNWKPDIDAAQVLTLDKSRYLWDRE